MNTDTDADAEADADDRRALVAESVHLVAKVRRSQGAGWFMLVVVGILDSLATPFMRYDARTALRHPHGKHLVVRRLPDACAVVLAGGTRRRVCRNQPLRPTSLAGPAAAIGLALVLLVWKERDALLAAAAVVYFGVVVWGGLTTPRFRLDRLLPPRSRGHPGSFCLTFSPRPRRCLWVRA